MFLFIHGNHMPNKCHMECWNSHAMSDKEPDTMSEYMSHVNSNRISDGGITRIR